MPPSTVGVVEQVFASHRVIDTLSHLGYHVAHGHSR
jgi:hypothetical protein